MCGSCWMERLEQNDVSYPAMGPREAKLDYRALLRGRYEAERLPRDFSAKRIVPDFAFNVLNPLGLLYRPVVDEAWLTSGGQRPIWPDGKPFGVCLTHDVDHVALRSLRQSMRVRTHGFRNVTTLTARMRNFLGFGFDVIRTMKREDSRASLCCFEHWLEVEESVGARSTFFFWPGWDAVSKHHPSDCTYVLTDRVVFDGQKCTVAEVIRQIDRRGWEIALHASWYSYNDVDELKRQKEALEKALGKDVVSVRQHFLHYDIRITPRIQCEAGFKYDSTLGFNDNVGFRFGTCYPFRLYDLNAEEELPILEVPLIIQDGAMLSPTKGMRLDEHTAFQYIVQLTEAVERVGGVLTLLWHPNAIVRPHWWNLYLRTLDYLKSKNAWFGTVQDIGSQKWPDVSDR